MMPGLARASKLRARQRNPHLAHARAGIFGLFACSRLGAVSLACIAAVACDGATKGAASPGARHPLLGNPAPGFELAAQSGGKKASLEQAQGKVALVDFWATWCAPCKASFPKYEALARKYGDDVVVIGISEDDESEDIRTFAQEAGATFLLAWDGDRSVAGRYHPESMPTSFIVDRRGLVRFVHAGFRAGEEKDIEREVKSLLE